MPNIFIPYLNPTTRYESDDLFILYLRFFFAFPLQIWHKINVFFLFLFQLLYCVLFLTVLWKLKLATVTDCSSLWFLQFYHFPHVFHSLDSEKVMTGTRTTRCHHPPQLKKCSTRAKEISFRFLFSGSHCSSKGVTNSSLLALCRVCQRLDGNPWFSLVLWPASLMMGCITSFTKVLVYHSSP